MLTAALAESTAMPGPPLRPFSVATGPAPELKREILPPAAPMPVIGVKLQLAAEIRPDVIDRSEVDFTGVEATRDCSRSEAKLASKSPVVRPARLSPPSWSSKNREPIDFIKAADFR